MDKQASDKGLANMAKPPPVPVKPNPFPSSSSPTFSTPPYSDEVCPVKGHVRSPEVNPPDVAVQPYTHFSNRVYGKPALLTSEGQQSISSDSSAVKYGSRVKGASEFDQLTTSCSGNSKGVGTETSDRATPRPLSPTKLLSFLSNSHSNQIPRPLKKYSSITKPIGRVGPMLELVYQKTTLAAMETASSLPFHSPILDPASRHTLPPPLEDKEEELYLDPLLFQDSFTEDHPPCLPPPDPTLNLQPPEVIGQVTVPLDKKSMLRKAGSERIAHSMRVKFNPLALLLDSSLEGEFDLVQRVIYEVDDPSMPNDEGITALHNAVCACHSEIVKFLLDFGVNVNAADSDGWTPLHCAASWNSVQFCKLLVESGAAVYATTYSDMQIAVDKCEEMEDGYTQCSLFLYGIQEKMGVMNRGVVYALWDYEPQSEDELGFIEGNSMTVLRREDKVETEWWWARCGDHEGYIPRNLLGMYPRIKRKLTNLSTTLGSNQYSASVMNEPTSQASESSPSYESSQAPSCFTPEVLNESGHISYRFSCPGSGVFQCMLTKLVFTMDWEGELLYRTVRWDYSLLQSAGKRPAGPLFDIKCSEEAVSKLHFPHCEQKPAFLSDIMSVVHISNDGMSILEPLEITDTHVVVDVSHLSAWGLVRDLINRIISPDPTPVCGQVLLFHRPMSMRQRPKINVFLLPENVLVEEVKEQHENAEYIVVPSSCDLIEGQTYSLRCSDSYKVQPKCARFNLRYGPNYHPTFEIRLTPSTDEVTVTVQDEEKKQVWEYDVELPGKEVSLSASISTAVSSQSVPFLLAPAGRGSGPRRENLQHIETLPKDEEKRLFSVRTEFINRVSSSVLKDLLDALLQHRVINSGEMDSIQVMPRADKARELIDTVLRKGKEACKILMDTFCEVDPFVSATLQLQ